MQGVVYRVAAQEKLYGFGDSILDVPILNESLGNYQARICAQCGLQIIDVATRAELPSTDFPLWYFDAKMVFTLDFLKLAIQRAKDDPTSFLQFGLKKHPSIQQHSLPLAPNDKDLLFPFFFKGSESKQATIIQLEGKEYDWQIHMPSQVMPGGVYSLNQNAVFATLLLSPFHLHGANMALNLNRGLKLQALLPDWLRKRISKPFTKLTSIGLKSMNQKGKNCRIHPTAVVEGCVLGDDVTIGANAVLRMSMIGSGTFVGDTAVVSFSVIGANNFVSTGNHLVNSMTYPSVFTIHGPYQYSIFGQHSAVFATINSDIRLDTKTIKIPTEVGVCDSDQILLGVAYGHRSKIGGSNIIAAGRLVPNDYVLNPPNFITLNFD
jgi:carbonic anhydrase/acetyltransferase-like protein (isoleucine patch superfamily)